MIKKISILLALAFCLNGKAQCSVYIGGLHGSICTGNSDTLTASGANSYTWMPGGANTASISVSPNVTTIYTVTGTTGTCTATDTYPVYVGTTPGMPILSSPSSNPVMACQGSPLTLSITPTGTVSCYTVWYAGTNFNVPVAYSTTSFSPPVTTVGTTVYSIIDSTYSCASSILTVTVIVNLCGAGIQQITNSNEVTIYPNPASSSLQVSFIGNIQNTTIEVYNTIGECVHRQIATSSNSQIDISDLAEGVYNISLISNEGVVNKRVVIVR